MYIILTEFNLKEHMDRMQIKHPNWTIWQLKCCLYWQAKARREHLLECARTTMDYKIHLCLRCPEAYGVHLFDTMKGLGIPLKRNPVNITRLISLGGFYK